MSLKSGHGNSARLTSSSPSDSPSISLKAPINVATAPLNVLFLGETNIGESSVVDLVAGGREQKRAPHHAGRSVTLDGKVFKLYTSPTNESTALVARERLQNTLVNLRKNGGVHLLVYCINALHPTSWIHEIHRNIVSNSSPSVRIPAIAVIVGISDATLQERWWSNFESTLATQGIHFDDHAFIQVMITGAQSSIGNYISESRHQLHAVILHSCAYGLNSESDSDLQSGKPSFHMPASPRAINVVLLGEIGVGKSSLVNLIAKKKVAEVSPDTIGCTKATVKYTFEGKGRVFHLYDTPGLVDPQMGTKPFVDPIVAISKLARSLGDGNGPDLLLFCIDNSRPTVALRRNYRLFCKIICEGKVPFALAITKLEQGQSAEQWWSEHRATIRSYGIHCSGHVGIGHEKKHLHPHSDSEGQLKESLLSFLAACADRRGHRGSGLLFSMGRILISTTSFLRPQGLTLESTLTSQCGLEKWTAQELANRLTSLR